MALTRTGRNPRRPPHRGPNPRYDWTGIYKHYIEKNMARKPGDLDYSLKDASEEFGIAYDLVRAHAARGHWRAELMKLRRQVEIAATRETKEQIESEAQVRLRQAAQTDAMMTIVEGGIERVLAKMEEDPEWVPDLPASLVRAFDRSLRQKREALGLATQVEIKDQTGEDSPLNRLARLHDRQDLAGQFQELLDEV